MNLTSPQVEDLENYKPQDPSYFSFTLVIAAGPGGEDGVDLFYVVVCTPKWLLQKIKESEIMPGRHLLIVKHYDFGEVREFLTRYVESCVGDSWDDVAQKIGRIAQWEYEDYDASGDEVVYDH